MRLLFRKLDPIILNNVCPHLSLFGKDGKEMGYATALEDLRTSELSGCFSVKDSVLGIGAFTILLEKSLV